MGEEKLLPNGFKNIIPDSIDFAGKYRESEARAFVHRAGVFTDEVVKSFAGGNPVAGDRLPWPKFGDDLKFRKKEVTVYFGYKGHTKSGIISEVFCNLMSQGRKCLVISPEFPVAEVLRRKIMQSAATGDPGERYARSWFPWANETLWLFDQQKKLSPDTVLGVVYHAIHNLGINHIAVDSLMKCGVKGYEGSLYAAQADFMDRLQNLIHGSDDTHLHMIMHARKGQDDSKPPSIHDVKGASELIDLAENAVSVWMDKGKWKNREAGQAVDNLRPDVVLTVEAQRNNPKLGTYGLWFAPGLRFAEQHNAIPAPYFDAGRKEF